MKESFISVVVIVGIVLFVAHRKEWIGQHTLQALGIIFGIIGGLSAVFLFIIPAAAPTGGNKNQSSLKPAIQNPNLGQSKSSKLENSNSTYSEIVIPHSLITVDPTRSEA